MASSSSSLPAPPNWDWDVFVSFCGEDTRLTFVGHLFAALKRKGLRVFRDDTKLERGKSIAPELSKAIRGSRYAIVVFSKNYASSSWCLHELVEIMECREAFGETVLPVFYHVDPCDVRKQTGIFGEGFARHVGSNSVEAWRSALVEAANISGWELKNTANGHEADFIEKLVQHIFFQLNHLNSSVDESLVGMETRVREVISSLDIGSTDVRMIGIYGMGGAGKTTLAWAIYDKISYLFDDTCFVESLKETLKQHGIKRVQQDVLSKLFKEKDLRVYGENEGKRMMSKLLRSKRVLVVLDDVDDLDELRALAGDCSQFGKGSRIIVTTRDEHLLEAHKVDKRHKVQLLDTEEAIQLLCKFAFGTNTPPSEFIKPSNDLVRYAAGLPLALKVLGSFLFGTDVEEWESTLARLKDVPENKIHQILKISYDGLRDNEKEIFLDIACCHRGWRIDSVMEKLEYCGLYPKAGMRVLAQKSLIDLSDDRVGMHDLIKEMGRHIVQGEYPDDPKKHSRIWQQEKLREIFTHHGGEELQGTEEIKLIYGYISMVNLKGFFMHMNKLRMLSIYGLGRFSEAPHSLPNGLRYLRWDHYPGESLPASFEAQKLAYLELWDSNIVQLWEQDKSLSNLRELSLCFSTRLLRTPNFSEIRHLTRLNLRGCTSLEEIHPSVGDLDMLAFLSLENCEALKAFPPIITMKSLQHFDLSGCNRIQEFPKVQGNMDKLQYLDLSHTAIGELPSSSIGKFSKCLSVLKLKNCSRLEKLPSEIGLLKCLETLHVNGVGIAEPPLSILSLETIKFFSFSNNHWLSRDLKGPFLLRIFRSSSLKTLELMRCGLRGEDFPVDIGTLSCLEVLDLTGNEFSWLPNSFSQLHRLQRLVLKSCSRLEGLPELPSSLRVINLDECISLKSIAGTVMCKWLRGVCFRNCHKLLENEHLTRDVGLLLQSLFQGIAVQSIFSIVLPGPINYYWGSIIKNQAAKGNQFLLELPQNWHTKFSGLLMYFWPENISSSTEVSMEPQAEHETTTSFSSPLEHAQFTSDVTNATMHLNENEHVWLGYVGLDCFGDPADLKTRNFLVTFYGMKDHGVKLCGVQLVQKWHTKPSIAPDWAGNVIIRRVEGCEDIDIEFPYRFISPC